MHVISPRDPEGGEGFTVENGGMTQTCKLCRPQLQKRFASLLQVSLMSLMSEMTLLRSHEYDKYDEYNEYDKYDEYNEYDKYGDCSERVIRHDRPDTTL